MEQAWEVSNTARIRLRSLFCKARDCSYLQRQSLEVMMGARARGKGLKTLAKWRESKADMRCANMEVEWEKQDHGGKGGMDKCYRSNWASTRRLWPLLAFHDVSGRSRWSKKLMVKVDRGWELSLRIGHCNFKGRDLFSREYCFFCFCFLMYTFMLRIPVEFMHTILF